VRALANTTLMAHAIIFWADVQGIAILQAIEIISWDKRLANIIPQEVAITFLALVQVITTPQALIITS
jgi:hypothetical protein